MPFKISALLYHLLVEELRVLMKQEFFGRLLSQCLIIKVMISFQVFQLEQSTVEEWPCSKRAKIKRLLNSWLILGGILPLMICINIGPIHGIASSNRNPVFWILNQCSNSSTIL